MKSLRFLVGKEVDIFNPNDSEAVDGFMASGRVLEITEGWIILAHPRSGEADFAVNLSHVGMVAVREAGPTMEALPGGKVHRLHRTPEDSDEK